ncbi:medium-chain acyl-CoA ligase ACSF2, mitochondrial-like [Ptychodera flava]|uniref:medium-chain acyl-CoA ligase ACSF2, mitochondrial-like n=1 Tax=Ptychodera flava TaxID=63121 RepID=UPI00396A6722
MLFARTSLLTVFLLTELEISAIHYKHGHVTKYTKTITQRDTLIKAAFVEFFESAQISKMLRATKPAKSYSHATSRSPLIGKTLCDSLDQSAVRFATREAFVFVENGIRKPVTFKQLRDDVIALAAGLVHLGLKSGQRLGIWVTNRYEWITSYYASAYTKLQLVRVPTGFKEEKFEYVMNKTKVTALIVSPGAHERMLLNVAPETPTLADGRFPAISRIPTLRTVIHLGHENKAGMIRYEDVMKMGNEEDYKRLTDLRESVDADDEVMILFTSGSTGWPKAVVRSHRCVVESIHAYGRRLSELLDADICYLAVTKFSNSSAEHTLAMGVIHGFKVVVPDEKYEVEELAHLMKKEAVTVAWFMCTFIFDFLHSPRLRELDLSDLRYMAVTGNRLPKDAVEEFRNSVNPNFYDLLGSTELGAITFNEDPEKFDKTGYPMDHFEAKIISDRGHIVPRGIIGELCLRSPYTMLRYEDDEDETKAALDQSGWFHTGDLCKMEEDGCLDIIGRKKEVIIKGSIKVYPQEVDSVLIRHPAVKVSETIRVPDERSIEEVCSCVCLKEGEKATVDDLFQFARLHLSETSLPKYVLFFDSFPIGPTGKHVRNEIAEKAKQILSL